MIKDFFKRVFAFKISFIGILTPFYKLQINSMKNYIGINENTKRTPSIIISLFAERENFEELSITIFSLLNQSLKPDKIILWLDEEYEDLTTIPYDISQYIKNGLEIRFTKNYGTFTKTISAFRDYSNSIIVTTENNVYYPYNWLKLLYLSYISHQEDIHVHTAYKFDTEYNYNKNKKNNLETAEFDNYFSNKGGVLFPPNCYTNEALRSDIFNKISQNNSELWFWIMALVHNRKIRIVNNHIKNFISLSSVKLISFMPNNKSTEEFNKDFATLMTYYKQNVIPKLKNNINK